MTRKVFNYGGGMHSPTALTAFLRDALDGDVADGMKVVAGNGMNVTVQAGTARVGRDPSYDINVTGTESVDVGAASPSNPMNAVIVAYVDRSVAGSTSVTDNTNNVFKLKAVSGAAAASPSDPSSSTIQSAIGAANPYIILARVRKRAGATSVVASDITDLRVMVTLKAGRINSGHLSDGIVLPRHINNDGIAKILYSESPYRDLNIQYASVESGQISITKPGDYLLIASFQQQTWKNGTGADVDLSIYKNSSMVDRAAFNTSNWHFGFVQKKVSLAAGDKIKCVAQVQQAVSMSLSARLSAIPISVLS